ncbi:MAG: hypothetical protein ACTHKM_06360 [Tsuneonella sp.]
MIARLSGLPLIAAAMLAAPALAQNAPAASTDEKVNMVIVYGDDACPPSSGNEITVCARKEESERYRIPESLRFSDDPKNIAWTERVERYETVGAFGTMSCSPTGAGGFTGCTQQLIDAAYADKKQGSDVRFGQLIQQEREKRLSTIDADAAAEQARVEQIEKQYMERLKKESEQATPGEQSAVPQPAGDSGRAPPPPQG